MCRGIGVQWYVPCTFPSARQPDSQPTGPSYGATVTCECLRVVCAVLQIFIIVLPMLHLTCVMHHNSSNGTQCLLSPGGACFVLSSRI